MNPKQFDKMLPKMKCDHGCGECCGVVACDPSEDQRVRDWAANNGVKPVKQGTTCPWFQEGKCSVYPVRPLVCRLFGHSDRMICPRGYNTNIAKQVEQYIWRTAGRQMKSPLVKDMTLLHFVVMSAQELGDLINESASKYAQLTIEGKESVNMALRESDSCKTFLRIAHANGHELPEELVKKLW